MVGQYSTRTMESSSNGASNHGDVSYQINCETTKKGKMFAGTKRRICWKFGFSNREALQRGLSGADCRGEEHEVVFVWSLTSGKKFVLADGHEVHWSKQSPFAEKFEGSWQCSWHSQMAGSKRLLEVVANTKKSNKNTSVADSSFRNFDLLIDGVPFSEMPQMFELGLAKDHRRTAAFGAQTSTQQPSKPPMPQRRKHIHDNEMGAASHHSYSSQKHQYSPRDAPRTSSSTNDLLYAASNHSYSSQPQEYSPRDASINSFSAVDLLDRTQPQPELLTPLASCNEFNSKSMPDLRYGFSTSPTSVMSAGESVPHFNYHHHQQQQPQQYLASPTSVMASNPFDFYASPTKQYPQQHQQQSHQIRAQYQNGTYAPYPQQHQQSTVY